MSLIIKYHSCTVYIYSYHSYHPQSHHKLVDGVVALSRRVQADKELTALIRRKFAIKCTTGRGGRAPLLDGVEGGMGMIGSV